MRRALVSSVLALVVWVTLAVAPCAARADGGPFGLGLIIGSPTGISLKYYLGGSSHAIDGAIGFSFLGADGLHLHADYLWHPFMLVQDPAFNLPLHFGIGARILDHDRGNNDDDDDLHVGVRAPVGVTFDFTEVPLDVFLAIALILDFHGDHNRNNDDDDSIDLDLNAGVGVRYYF